MKNSKTGLVKKIGVIVLVFSLVLLGTLLLKSIPGTALSRAPETFTELFFTDHLSLPKQLELGTQYEFEFSVHNLEHKDFAYDYEIIAADEENKLALAQGRFLLKQNERITVPVTFSISQSFERVKITVKIVNKNQQIHFWVEQAEQEED